MTNENKGSDDVRLVTNKALCAFLRGASVTAAHNGADYSADLYTEAAGRLEAAYGAGGTIRTTAPSRGCICPAEANLTCNAPGCPRGGPPVRVTLNHDSGKIDMAKLDVVLRSHRAWHE